MPSELDSDISKYGYAGESSYFDFEFHDLEAGKTYTIEGRVSAERPGIIYGVSLTLLYGSCSGQRLRNGIVIVRAWGTCNAAFVLQIAAAFHGCNEG